MNKKCRSIFRNNTPQQFSTFLSLFFLFLKFSKIRKRISLNFFSKSEKANGLKITIKIHLPKYKNVFIIEEIITKKNNRIEIIGKNFLYLPIKLWNCCVNICQINIVLKQFFSSLIIIYLFIEKGVNGLMKKHVYGVKV